MSDLTLRERQGLAFLARLVTLARKKHREASGIKQHRNRRMTWAEEDAEYEAVELFLERLADKVAAELGGDI